jgi:DNA-binding transcriptional MocR family regulator
MTIWFPDLEATTGPRHRALTDAIAVAIAEGALAEGARLPPQRELAFAMGLSLGTVTRAYRDAMARGLICGEVGRGTFVCASKTDRAPLWEAGRRDEGPIRLVMNLPPAGMSGSALADTLKEIADEGRLEYLLDHHASGRIEAHHLSAAQWLARLGIAERPEQIVMANGAQHGLLATFMAITRPGDTILAERLTYPPLRQMAHHLGLRILGVDLDHEGLVPSALEDACRRGGARVVYCMPTLHSPTGATMGSQRRAAVAAIARKHELTIVEDDVFGFLPSQRPPPLVCLAPERTVLVTSASKCMAPGLRVGMILAPPQLHGAVRNAVQMSCWMPAPLMTEVFHRWVSDGTAMRLNDWLRQEMAARLASTHRILGRAVETQAGMRFHLWLELPEGLSEQSFQAALEAQGVTVATGQIFQAHAGPSANAVRLALGYETSRTRLERGLQIVADTMAEPARHHSMVV